MDIEDSVKNFLLFFVLFCLAGALYTRVAVRSTALKNAVGI